MLGEYNGSLVSFCQFLCSETPGESHVERLRRQLFSKRQGPGSNPTSGTLFFSWNEIHLYGFSTLSSELQ